MIRRASASVAVALWIVDAALGPAAGQSPAAPDPASSFAERLERNPLDRQAMVGRVEALLASDRWRTALEEARAYSAVAPDDRHVTTALAEALFRAGELAESEALLVPIVERPDAPARAQLTLGRLYDARGRSADAVDRMDRAVAAADDDPWVMYWSADATRSRAEAIERLERYVELAGPDDEDRIEAAEGSLRLYRALGETPIWVDENRPERAELPLRQLWDPTTSATIGYVIEARIGDKDKPVKLLLDTGSPGLYVIDRIADKRGFRELSLQTTFGGGGDRRHATRRGFFDSFAVGELSFRSALATAAKHEIDPLGRFHGVVGISIFNGYRVTLDLAAERLVLAPIDEEPAAGAPYWVVGGQWLVEASIVPDGRSGLFLLDTGATRSLLSLALLDGLAAAVVRQGAEVHGFGGMIDGAREVDGVRLDFHGLGVGPGGLRAADLSLQSKMGGVELSGFVGLDLLEGPVITIDTERRTVRVEANDDSRR
ncbi:MAG TPA: aspartyl protease family protein [Candidatus Polarisedimenticolaceae bacterium]|nr:aspartyl protease family protein [Candidatus Polarisedimenticolaceae bacterium]